METNQGRAGKRVDVDTGMLRRDHVLVQATPDAYFCVGFGPGASRLWRRVNEADSELDLSAGDCPHPITAPLRAAIAAIDDSILRRLAVAEALAKAGYDPAEPRDDIGRWTAVGGGDRNGAESSGTGSGGAAAIVATTATAELAAGTAEALFGNLGRRALAGLTDLGASFVAPAAFLGTLFIPTNDTLQVEGTLPGQPDVSYQYDRDTGALTLTRNGVVVYAGHAGMDGIFRDTNGQAFGRNLAGSIVLDARVHPSAVAQGAGAGANVRARADTDSDEPKLCPDPALENIKDRSERALLYQEQISGLPRGWIVRYNGVDFDGCKSTNGMLIEGKAEGYAWAMTAGGGWKKFYRGADEIMKQARNNLGQQGYVWWSGILPRSAWRITSERHSTTPGSATS